MGDSTLNSQVSFTTRKKVASVKKGFGLHDWNRLLSCSSDLAQRKGAPIRQQITQKELSKHATLFDGWIGLHGKVYNIGPYLPYHPGGTEIMLKCLGQDATPLFEKYHHWVNIERLVGPLLVGYLVIDTHNELDDDNDEKDGHRIDDKTVSSNMTPSSKPIFDQDIDKNSSSNISSSIPPVSKSSPEQVISSLLEAMNGVDVEIEKAQSSSRP